MNSPRHCSLPFTEFHTYCVWLTWEGGAVTEEMCVLYQAGTCPHCLLPLKSLCSAGWRESRAAESVVMGAEPEAMAFFLVDPIAPWSSWQDPSALPARPSAWTAMPHLVTKENLSIQKRIIFLQLLLLGCTGKGIYNLKYYSYNEDDCNSCVDSTSFAYNYSKNNRNDSVKSLLITWQ